MNDAQVDTRAESAMSSLLHKAEDLPAYARGLLRKAQQMPAYVRGMEGYAYGFPLVIMDVTRGLLTATATSGEYKAPVNQFGRIRTLVDPDFTDVVRISRNSLWSHAFVDLDEEPIVYSQPDTKGRFIVMQALNMWTDDFASSGSRTTGTKAGNFLIAGPKWRGTAPPDVKATFRSTTRYAWVLVQIAADGPQDYAEVNALQDALKLTPLSAWGRPYTPPDDVPVDDTVDTTATPFDQLRLMSGATFFERLVALMVDNPPYPDDAPILKKLKAIGVEPGQSFDADHLDPKHLEALDRAARTVFRMLETAPYDMKTVNGWLLPLNLGRYGTDYNTRAFVAYLGLGALPAEDCVYPSAFVDGDGKPLDGAHAYVIHFERDGTFPSHSGVWSISAYREHFYVHNPIERYAITSGMPLTYNPDGSLDVYIQARSPGADKESNWLPCPPSGRFNLSARSYQPKAELMDGRTDNGLVVEAGSYTIPAVTRVTRSV